MKWISIILVFLVIVRLLLPHAILFFVNRSIGKLKEFRGHVKKVQIHLIQLRVSLQEIHLYKLDPITGLESPFFEAVEVNFTTRWKSLLQRSLVADINILQPLLLLIKDNTKPEETATSKDKAEKDDLNAPSTSSLKTMLQGVLPFRVNLTVSKAKLHYTDPTSVPVVTIALTDLQLSINDFSTRSIENTIPAIIHATGHIYEGEFDFKMKLFPMAEQPTFDLNMELKNTNMVLLNDFFRAYAKIDVNKGTFGMYTEVAAKGGEFKGYVKPVITDLDIIGAEDKGDSVFRKLWEGLVAVVVQVLENNKNDQIATKIFIEGKLDNPHVNIFQAIAGILQNAFIRAIHPSLDHAISIGSVMESAATNAKGFIKGLLRKSDDK